MRLVPDAARSRRLSALACLLVAAGCGSSEHPTLSWVAQPKVVKPAELPRDRVLIGRVRNETGERLRLESKSVRVLDAKGRALRSTARFSSAYAHGLYSYEQQPKEGDPEFEQVRLGELALIPAHRTAPLTVSWRLRTDAGPAARIEIGRIRLAIR